MKKLPALVMSLLSALSLLNHALPVCAQHANSKGGFYKYKPGELQKPEWRQYKGELQIIDDTPDVKDFRKPKDQGPTYQIEIPPMQNQQGGGVGINGGGNNNAGQSPVIKLTPSRDNRLLAPPGTESNMNSLRAPSGNLPSGTSTGIHSNMRPPQGKPSSLTPKSGKHELLNKVSPKVQNNSVPSTYKNYEKINASNADSNNSSVRLTGELKNGGRGSILRNAK